MTISERGLAPVPYEYRVADTEGLIHVTAWGDADLVEIVALVPQLEADARVRRGMPLLVDARNQHFRLPPLQLRQLADLHARSGGGGLRPVAVVCAPGLNYGLGRMLSVFSEMREHGSHGQEA